ncbi:unnamed protein product [Mytilus edulis]|uniref:Protein fem-1 homolog B n=1 Tax=Mytilus edulis TaxID=6550 RepID=A0A8S3U0P7_MYTED|nr:unnamed protein product [Mytilus edulis]
MYLRQLEILIERETIMQSNISAVSNSVDELRQQSNTNRLDISDLNTKVTSLQTEQEETIPKNKEIALKNEYLLQFVKTDKYQINKDIEEWKIKDNKFVPTRASAHASDQLNKTSFVILTGSPGMGKTFLARHIALDVKSEEFTDEHLEWYLDRLMNDWSEGKVTVVITNPNMNDELFRNQFLSKLHKLEKNQQVKLANTQDTFEIKKKCGTSGSYPIISACFEGYIDIVRWLLDNAVDVNQCRDDGNTSLFMACYNGHKDIVSLLLKKNHSVNMCNEKGVTPLFIACERGYTEIGEA